MSLFGTETGIETWSFYLRMSFLHDEKNTWVKYASQLAKL